MSEHPAILFLNNLWSSPVMLFIWLVPLFAGVKLYKAKRIRRIWLLWLLCAGPIAYYIWAASGLWSSHFVALAFRRTADFTTALAALVFILTFGNGKDS